MGRIDESKLSVKSLVVIAALVLAACGGGSGSGESGGANSGDNSGNSGGNSNNSGDNSSDQMKGGVEIGTACETDGETASIPNGTGICAVDSTGALIWQKMGPDGKPTIGDNSGNSGSSNNQSSSNEPDYFFPNWDITTAAALAPKCTTKTPLSVLPTAVELIDFMWPLGYSQPGAHALPVPHHNVHVAKEKTIDENGVERRSKLIDPVVAPSDATLVGLARNVYSTKTTSGQSATYEEYMLSLHVCDNLYLVFNHLDLVPSAWLDAVKGSSVREECNQGQDKAEVCMWSNLSVPIKAGERLGRSSGRAHGWDIGATDTSRPMEHRIDPAAYTGRWAMATCVFDLFTPDLKAKLYSKITTKDNCGRVDFDYPNTLSGVWLAVGMRERAAFEDLHIALYPKYTYDGTLRFTIGLESKVAGLKGGIYEFKPEASGLRNPAFTAVKPNEVACFDGLAGQSGMKLETTRIYATMTTAGGVETISIAGAGTGKCGDGPYTMPAQVTQFERRVGN